MRSRVLTRARRVAPQAFAVGAEEIEAAAAAVPAELRDHIAFAQEQVRSFAPAQLETLGELETEPAHGVVLAPEHSRRERGRLCSRRPLSGAGLGLHDRPGRQVAGLVTTSEWFGRRVLREIEELLVDWPTAAVPGQEWSARPAHPERRPSHGASGWGSSRPAPTSGSPPPAAGRRPGGPAPPASSRCVKSAERSPVDLCAGGQ